MTYFAHGVTLALAWFLATSVAMSAITMIVAGRVRGSAASLLALRLLPAVLSMAFVTGVFVPSYWRFEPRDFAEGFDVTLTTLAAGGAVLLTASVLRGAAAWYRAARRAQAWTRTAQLLPPVVAGLPAFRIESAEPVLALVGIFRPRLIVTRGLVDALTPEELAASIEHEIGHYRSWDNLKRLAMRAAPDVLHWAPAAGQLERKWAAASEQMADAGASRSRATRLALASALVKVARLMPAAAASLADPISTLGGGGEIAARVQRLIDDDPEVGGRGQDVARAVAGAAVAVLLVTAYVPLLEHVHRVTEILVHALP